MTKSPLINRSAFNSRITTADVTAKENGSAIFWDRRERCF